MFTRIMAVVLTVILLLTGVVSGIGWMALREQRAETIMETLRSEAREIAYLAAQQNDDTEAPFYDRDQDSQRMLMGWKAKEIYDAYGAYILVVNRNGSIVDNMNITYAKNPDFAQTLNRKEIMEGLNLVLSGKEIELRVNVGGEDYFTVGIPFVHDGMVLGAVFMQTPAQAISAGASELLLPVAGIAAAAAVLAGLTLFLILRGVMKPLSRLTQAARTMAYGDFSVRVPSAKAPREIAELSAAFNTMAYALSQVEDSRREFVANVSHELRSPITSIRGYIQGMRDGVIPQEDHDKYLAIVSDESKRLSQLIGELLALSRLEREDAALICTYFDVCDLMERVFLRRSGDLEARSLDVDCDFDPEPCFVWADMARIDQVLMNLLDNAIKFTPDGGKITLRVRAEGGLCTVTVADNGVGILPEDRPRVFERFFTADRAHTSGKGTGLGLSICQRIMEMHRQPIRLLDTDEGAAFAFTLELAKK